MTGVKNHRFSVCIMFDFVFTSGTKSLVAQTKSLVAQADLKLTMEPR